VKGIEVKKKIEIENDGMPKEGGREKDLGR
jgi:hypothetical protein